MVTNRIARDTVLRNEVGIEVLDAEIIKTKRGYYMCIK